MAFDVDTSCEIHLTIHDQMMDYFDVAQVLYRLIINLEYCVMDEDNILHDTPTWIMRLCQSRFIPFSENLVNIVLVWFHERGLLDKVYLIIIQTKYQ
jgi:hypothetical protein